MIFVRILNILVKHEKIGKRIVPIVPDEARTFGMEGMFRQLEYILLTDSFMSQLTMMS